MAIPVLRGRAFTDADFAQGRRLVVVTEAWARRDFPGEILSARSLATCRSTRSSAWSPTARFSTCGPTSVRRCISCPAGTRSLQRARGADGRRRGRGRARRPGRDPRHQPPPADRRADHASGNRRGPSRASAWWRQPAPPSACLACCSRRLASSAWRPRPSRSGRRNGHRMALGAGRWTVVREVLGETLQVFAAGLAAGLVLAAIAVRLTATVVGDSLFGVTATDTATVAGAALVMLLVATMACLLPARRAVSIDLARGHPRSTQSLETHGPSRSGPEEDQGIQERDGVRRLAACASRARDRDLGADLQEGLWQTDGHQHPRRSMSRCAGAGSTASARDSTTNAFSSATRRGARKSLWSQVNREHVARLTAAGRMPAARAAAGRPWRRPDGRWDAAYAPMRAATEATAPGGPARRHRRGSSCTADIPDPGTRRTCSRSPSARTT